MAKILLVEDAPDLAQLIARELRASQYDVIIADNGVAALDLHAHQRYGQRIGCTAFVGNRFCWKNCSVW